MTIINIGSTIRFSTRSLPPLLVREIRDHLTFVPRRAPYGSKRGAKPEPVLFFRENRGQGRMVLPRGSLNEIRSLFARHRIGMEFRVSGVVSSSSGRRDPGALAIQLREL